MTRWTSSFWLRLFYLSAGAGLVLLGALFVLKVSLISELQGIAPQVQLRQHYHHQLQTVSGAVYAIQAARRGFMLTADPGFAQTFEDEAAILSKELARLDADTAAVAASTGLSPVPIGPLKARIAEYESHLRASIVAHGLNSNDRAAQEDSTNRGEAMSRVVHNDLGALESWAEGQFDTEITRLLIATQQLLRSELLLSGIALAMVLSAVALARGQARTRAMAQAALVSANASLEIKVAERTAALFESEQHFKSLVELSADAILLCDANRAIAYANPTALSMLNPAHSTALNGRLIESLFETDTQQSVTKWLDEIWSGPRRHSYRELNLISADNLPIPVHIGALSFMSRDSLCVQLVAHDLTEIHAKEAATREQLRFIDQLFEAIPTPFSVRDERGRYLRVNGAYELLAGSDRTRIRHKSVFDVWPYPLASVLAQKDSEAMRSLRPVTYEVAVNAGTASAATMRATSCALRRADGTVIGVITVTTDVSPLRAKEAELQLANTALEALSQQLIHAQEAERRRIARELHDQIGQVLTALKMSLQVLQGRGIADPHAIQAAIDLTNEALEQSRMLTASLHPHMLEDLGLAAAVHWVIDRFVRPSIRQVGFAANVEPPRSNAGNELVAFRVTQEALTNAVRHAQADAVKVELNCRGGQLYICISDNGCGFEVGTTAFDARRPTSLGLASMRERVAELGGDFTVESVDGAGTTVRATLPW